MTGNDTSPLDVLLVIPKQGRNPLIRDDRFAGLGAGFHIPYYISYLRFCRKLGVDINLSRKGIPFRNGNGVRTLRPNNNPSHTALLLATLLDRHHYRFRVIDPNLGFPGSARRVFIRHLKRKPKILAISTTFIISAATANDLMRLARKYSPQTRIIVGGQLLLTARKSMDEMKLADAFVIGECEDNLAPLVNALINEDRPALSRIKGIVFREGEEWIRNPPSPPVDLEKAPPIQWQLMREFHPPRMDLDGYIMIEDGRGCPFQCAYCSYRKNFAYRLKSADKVISELKAVPRQGEKINIFFSSSAFTFPPDRAMEIARRIRAEKLSHRYGAYGRVQDITEEFVRELKASDFYWLFLGLESMNADVLRLVKKNTTPNQIEHAVRLCFQAGIIADCSFIVGLPGETRESVKKIAAFLQKPYVGRYCLFPLADMDSSDLADRPGLYGFDREDYVNWRHEGMSSREIPPIMAEIIIEANRSGYAYSTFIIDTLIGNEISSDPLTAIPHDRVKPFYLLMETGTALYLRKRLHGERLDRDRLHSTVCSVKRDYLPRIPLRLRAVNIVKISLKILALRIAGVYLSQRKAKQFPQKRRMNHKEP